MKESTHEGIASHMGLESCLDLPRGGGEALTGEAVWQDLQLGNGTAVSRQYDELMRLTNMVNATDAGVLSSFAIAVDDADQRTQVIREDRTRYDYSYDPAGQLTNAAATLADDTPWQAYQYGYQYDAAGNPLEQDRNGLVYSNSFNPLNQNVATVPGGSLTVLGHVNYAGGTVTVNSAQAQISPDLIFAATGVPFTLGTNVLNTVFTDSFGRSTNRETTVVVAPRAYHYDANGNLTNDGRMAYFWNDENRLVAVRDAKTGALIQENRYDGLGRRREKVEHGDDGPTTNRYIYQEWLVLAVTDGEGIVLETYTHGADLSGRVGGSAGGVGGILASTQAEGEAYYHYDFNGNVVNVSGSNQTQLAKYTYGPFGEVLLKEGSLDFRYQFSTKEYDAATELNYYGYRFYSTKMGRWISKDPIGEYGGINLYTSIFNNPLTRVDYLGLHCRNCEDEYNTCIGHAKIAYDSCINDANERARQMQLELVAAAQKVYNFTMEQCQIGLDNMINLCEKIDTSTWTGAIAYSGCLAAAYADYYTVTTAASLALAGAYAAITLEIEAFHAGEVLGCTLGYQLEKRSCARERDDCLVDYGTDDNGCPCKK